MEIKAVVAGKLNKGGDDTCLVVPVYEKEFPLRSAVLDPAHAAVFAALAGREAVTGKAQSTYYLPTPGAVCGGVLTLGLGKRAACDAETLRRAAGKAVRHFARHRVTHLVFDASAFPELPLDAFVEGLVLAQYDFEVYRKRPEDTPAPVKVASVTVVVADGGLAEAIAHNCGLAALIATGVNGARQLANTAANEMTPAALAEFAQGIAQQSACKCTVLDEKKMAKLGMNALLGVAKGADNEPKLIVLEYRHPKAVKTVAIAGKGVCFDSGGISIKPAQNMHEMKYDMSGAAAVLCAMMTIAWLRPRVNVIAVVPAVENKTGSRAQTPGDIVRAYNGKTIEVHNTDAEGRLILADAMAYTVDRHKPDMIVDLATLTGACVVALGHCCAGILGNNDALIDGLIKAGEATGDRLWKLPLWKDYKKQIEGTHADLCNIGPGRDAGAITAAAFLEHFVGDTPWAHLDIAGVAYGVKGVPHLNPKHATGFGVRLLTRWIMDLAAEK
jgi:leucyl aminopeptidase